MKGFARREFQLMLLRRMADFQPERVTDAYTELAASHADYMAAHNRWQTLLHSRRAPRGLDLYHAVLGPSDAERPIQFGDVQVTACSWRLPGLWPQLRWEVTVGSDNVVLHGWLVRADDSPAPETLDLAPWSCVVGDVMTRFPQAQQADPQVPSQWTVQVDTRRLWFAHGLLQATTVARQEVWPPGR